MTNNSDTSSTEKERHIKERLGILQNIDFSDIRINFDIEYRNEGKNSVALALFRKEGYVEIVAKSWLPQFKNFENIIYAINHESIHPVIDRIFYEDGFAYEEDEKDSEWAFYAGGIDEICGMNGAISCPTYYLSIDALRNTLKFNPEWAAASYRNLDYDL